MTRPLFLPTCHAMLLAAFAIAHAPSFARADEPAAPAPAAGANGTNGAESEAVPAAQPPRREVHPPVFVEEDDEQSVALLRRLRETNVSWRFEEMPLREWAKQYLEKELNASVIFDERELANQGIGLDNTAFSLDVTNVTAEEAIGTVCRNLGLGRLFIGGSILFTSHSVCEGRMPLRMYDATDFASHPRGAERSMEKLVQLIQSHIDPDSWDTMGGSASAAYTVGEHAVILHVSTTLERQLKIERLLEKLREIEEFHRPE